MQSWSGTIREGMTVHSADGHKLGKVVRSGPAGFVIEKGVFFKKEYLVRHTDVAGVDGDDIRLLTNRDALPRLDEPAGGTVVAGSGGTVREGMTAVSADGHKLGKVTSLGADGFTIEKGVYFPRDYLARFSDVGSVTGDEVHLVTGRDDLLRLEDRMKLEERGEWAARGKVPGADAPPLPDQTRAAPPASDENIRVPELEEDVTARARPVVRERHPVEQRVASDRVGRDEAEALREGDWKPVGGIDDDDKRHT
jgi:hypothetical protein